MWSLLPRARLTFFYGPKQISVYYYTTKKKVFLGFAHSHFGDKSFRFSVGCIYFMYSSLPAKIVHFQFPMHARWLEREDARTRLRANPSDRNLRKALKIATKRLKRARAEGVQRFFEAYVSQLEGRIPEGDQFGFYKNLKGMDEEGKRTFNSKYIRDEKGRLLRDIELVRKH